MKFAIFLGIATAACAASLAVAETIQIQLHGDMPKRLSAEILWLDTLTDGCTDDPCHIRAKSVRIKRHIITLDPAGV